MLNERIPYLKEKSLKLTEEPGCYIMKNKAGAIIYIGKAKNLKKRVVSYFRGLDNHHPKVERMVMQVYDYDYIVTSSEFEALVLECSLIKHHQPKYNILLKDDKGYHYIKISAPPYSRISAEMQRHEDGGKYIGPYTSRFVVKESVDEVCKSFKLPTCNRVFPRDIKKERPCLLFYIDQCSGVCNGRISEAEYNDTLATASEYLQSGSEKIALVLEERMLKAADELRFEEASRLRDSMNSIRKLREKQQVVFTSAPNQDVIGVVRKEKKTCAVIIKIRDGKLVDKQDFELGEVFDLESAREEFVHLYYYENRHSIPKQLSLDGEIENMELTSEHLSKLAGRKVNIIIPQKGEQKRLSEMAMANAAEILSHSTEIFGKDLIALDELADITGLKSPPLYIESYDISNSGDDYMVGGMVVFENGKPAKKNYKRFSIKTVHEQNDYAAMREMLKRRVARLGDGETDEGFARKPDMILIDGGKGHVSTIEALFKEENIDIPVFGMVKDGKHKTRALCTKDGEIALKQTSASYRFIYKVQEEVHRFAIAYHRISHKKASFQSVLTKIDGVGAVRAKSLMKHFKTIENISKADFDELIKVKGINESVAKAVVSHFRAG